MNSQNIRNEFIKYFKNKEHKVFNSSSLIPENDPTLLFTIAGMVQFKPMFAGLVNFDFKSAVSIQKCLRVVDLEEVGKSPFHDTFFEMLGNFSFNDYYKKDAINYAWDFLTNVLNLDKKMLYVTVHKDDDEAYNIWKNDIGLDENRIIRMDDKTNFWGPAGGTGACGPSSEIFYDFGKEHEDKNPCSVNNECRRFVEVWNLVFPQFNQDIDGKRQPLKNRGIDTGMGLERLAAAVQHKKNIFETDLFKPIIDEFLSIYDIDVVKNESFIHSIADHIRAITFAIGDGIIPENDGRGYVIRRILRRAVRAAYKMNIKEPFLYKLSSSAIDIMHTQYPYLNKQSTKIATIIKSEEERFLTTIGQGITLYNQFAEKASSVLDGEIIFKLYDTFGFPVDLTCSMAEEDGLKPDIEKFNILLKDAKEKSRKLSRFKSDNNNDWNIVKKGISQFTGYKSDSETSNILMYRESTDKKLELIFEKTPFYAESGGQVGDTGIIENKNGCKMKVLNTFPSNTGNVCLCSIEKGEFDSKSNYYLKIDTTRRKFIERNHTTTHLLHSALRKVLGEHVHQEGSYVEPDKFRFDFTHFKSLSSEELSTIEKSINDIVFSGLNVETEIKDYDEAVKDGAMALFNEKYDNQVRIVSVENVSKELCGGTHVKNTAEIGMFRIISESSIASGIRRIEGVTSGALYNAVSDMYLSLNSINEILKVTSIRDAENKILQLIDNNKIAKKQMENSIHNKIDIYIKKLKKQSFENNSITYIISILNDNNIKNPELRLLMDGIKSSYKKTVGIIASISENKLFVLAFSSNTNYDAGAIMKKINELTNGKGGGRKEMALGSAMVPKNIKLFEQQIREIIINE